MLTRLFGKKSIKKSDAPATLKTIPKHIAVIMDGNGRWAKARMLPRVEGHRAGAKSVRTLLEECLKLGVECVTVFAFSSENWNRPEAEVQALMHLFDRYLEQELGLFEKHNVRLRAIGDRTKLTPAVRERLIAAENKTKNNKAMQFIIAVSYGGREELMYAALGYAERCVAMKATPVLTEDMFRSFLYAPDVPDVDLLIRTSDEMRISNFLLWQIAYAEIVVTPVFWPDFDAVELRRCIAEFGGRSRRFGLTNEQLASAVESNTVEQKKVEV